MLPTGMAIHLDDPGLAAARGIAPATGPGRDGLRASIEKTLGLHALGSAWIAAWAWFGA